MKRTKSALWMTGMLLVGACTGAPRPVQSDDASTPTADDAGTADDVRDMFVDQGGVNAPVDAGTVQPDISPDFGRGEAWPTPVVTDDCGVVTGLQAEAPWPTQGRCFSRRGSTRVLSVQDPIERWTYALPANLRVSSGITIARDGTIYFHFISLPSGSEGLIAVSADGNLKWRYEHFLIREAPTIGVDGTLYVAGGGLQALTPDGKLAWHHKMDSGVTGFIIAADGSLYLGDSSGMLTVLSPQGAVRWTHKLDDRGITLTAIGTDGALLVTTGARLLSVGPNGDIRWAAVMAGGTTKYQRAVVGRDGTIFTIGSDLVAAVDPASGALHWQTTVEGALFRGISLGLDGSLLIIDSRSRLHALDPKDGRRRWAFAMGRLAHSPPAVAGDGTIYLSSTDETLYALSPDGLVKWVWRGLAYSPSIAADGTLLVPAYDRVVALGCRAGSCGACRPRCGARVCGPDGCGGTCGACGNPGRCNFFSGVCQAATGGDDACGDVRGLQPQAPWPTLGGCLTRNGRSSLMGPTITPIPKWTYDLGAPITNEVVIAADGTAYVGAQNGKLHAVAPDGTARWTLGFGPAGMASVRSTPAIGVDGTLYFSAPDRRFYAVAPDGKVRWTIGIQFDGGLAATIAPDGTVYLPTSTSLNDTTLMAVDPWMGALRWVTDSQAIRSAPLLGRDGNIHVTGFGGLLTYAPDGTRLSVTALPGFIDGVTGTGDASGDLYIAHSFGLTALRADRTTKWSFNVPGRPPARPVRSTPALGRDGSVILSQLDQGDGIVALDPMDGSVRWRAVRNSVLVSPLVDAAGNVFVGVAASTLVTDDFYGLDRNGNILWSTIVKASLASRAVLGQGGVLYIPTTDGKLIALGQ